MKKLFPPANFPSFLRLLSTYRALDLQLFRNSSQELHTVLGSIPDGCYALAINKTIMVRISILPPSHGRQWELWQLLSRLLPWS